MQLGITRMAARSPADSPYEMVERKGVGHPDTICDALAETFSRALSAYYVDRFGTVLHHNVDKALLVAGGALPTFGGGEVTTPIHIYLAGRAVTQHHGVDVPVEELAIEACRAWLRRHLHALDADRHVRLHVLVRPASSDLQTLFTGASTRLANDTSMGAGYAPLDDLERAVLEVERRLSASGGAAHPEIGEDIKVMGVRSGESVRLTVACAVVSRHVVNLDAYFAAKAGIGNIARAAAHAVTRLPVEVTVNAADGTSPESVYLTVTGTSAEAGDDGEVGRGNRVNGLITPYRPMTLEAHAGKNTVTHTGKLYNMAAHRMALLLATRVPGVEEAYCYLVSEIGQPVTRPSVVDVRLRLAPRRSFARIRARIEALVQEELDRIPDYWRSAEVDPPVAY